MRAFTYHRSSSIADAVDRHDRAAGVEYLAGGTTLLDLVKLDVMRPHGVVDINHLPLNRIEPTSAGGLRIGALVRNSDLAWDKRVQHDYPVLSQALLSGASAQLRNMATTAGNLLQRTRCPYFRDNISPCNKRQPGSGCAAIDGYNRSHAVLGTSDACIATHPSDMCVALAVLDATVCVHGSDGEREVPFAEFHRVPGDTPEIETALRPGDLVTSIVVPPPIHGARSRYLKLRDRESFEFALASVAVSVVRAGPRFADARIALGGLATKPWRAREAEAILRGALIARETFAAAADAALREARPRTHNAFKVPLARQAIVRVLEDVTAAESSPASGATDEAQRRTTTRSE